MANKRNETFNFSKKVIIICILTNIFFGNHKIMISDSFVRGAHCIITDQKTWVANKRLNSGCKFTKIESQKKTDLHLTSLEKIFIYKWLEFNLSVTVLFHIRKQSHISTKCVDSWYGIYFWNTLH